MPPHTRLPEVVGAILVVALLLGAVLLAECGGDAPKVSVSPQEMERVATRVEQLRGLDFKRTPEPRVVTSGQAKSEAIAELEEHYPEERQRADETVLKLLGLLGPDDSMREIQETLFGSQVAGYYDTRRRRLSLVSDVGGSDAVALEITVAHELVHALEDEHFDIREDLVGTDDDVTAYTALVEGSATALQTRYLERHIDQTQLLASGLAGISQLGEFEGLPPYIQAAVLFPYLEGEQFVNRLHDAGGGWRLVNFALEKRPPDSTEQVLHPEKYLRFEQPDDPALAAERVLGHAWRRISKGTIGEFDTAELLRLGDGDGADAAAAGWGGGTYEAWAREGEAPEDCEAPCRAHHAMVLSWTWDTAQDAGEFERALPAYVDEVLDGDAAVARDGDVITLALAPNGKLAERLVNDAPR